jgi:hypothetical protein
MKYELYDDSGIILASTSSATLLAADINLWMTKGATPQRLNVRHYYDDAKPEASRSYELPSWAVIQHFVVQAKVG